MRYVHFQGASPSPFFGLKDGKPLTRARLVLAKGGKGRLLSILQPQLQEWHNNNSSDLRDRRLNIKMLGQWKSSAYQVYIQILRDQLAAVLKYLAG